MGPSTTSGEDVAGTAALPLLDAIAVGSLEEIRASVAVEPMYVPEARAWLVAVAEPERADMVAAADSRLLPGLELGLLALYQACPHLGCRVPFCASSGWFECACHAAAFTPFGEHRRGPGERGMDLFPIVIEDDLVSINGAEIVAGAPVGTVVVDRPAVGPHCVVRSER